MEFPKNLKLIVFDFDGTLHDLVIDWDEAKRVAEVDEGESLGQAVERHKKSRNHSPLKRLTQLEAAALKDQVLNSEIAETLKLLHQKYMVAVLSRNSSQPIADLLDRSGVHPDMIIGREEISRLKPHPEALHLILKEMNVRPPEVLMVGDTWHDIEVAHTAGVKSAIVGNSVTTPKGNQPDYKLKSINALRCL